MVRINVLYPKRRFWVEQFCGSRQLWGRYIIARADEIMREFRARMPREWRGYAEYGLSEHHATIIVRFCPKCGQLVDWRCPCHRRYVTEGLVALAQESWRPKGE